MGEIVASSRGELERRAYVDPDHLVARRKSQLALAGEQHVPRLVLLMADQDVLAIGAEPAVGSGLGYRRKNIW